MTERPELDPEVKAGSNARPPSAGLDPSAAGSKPAAEPTGPAAGSEPAAGSSPAGRRLRLVHLFPDLLNVYGDAGNVRAIVVRATARGIAVSVDEVRAGSASIPSADILLIGGGQDREQHAVARELTRLGPAIRAEIAAGASLLAVCGGYQNLGRWYRTGEGATIEGPGILDLTTEAGDDRMVGPVLAELRGGSGAWSGRTQVVGFENHAGRTRLGPSARPLATVEIGRGNNGDDGAEGILALPGEDGLAGLRIGTYLHGPFLPRNPHVADALIAAGLGREGESVALQPLDDLDEWTAHDGYAARSRSRRRNERRMPERLARIVRPLRSLIGF